MDGRLPSLAVISIDGKQAPGVVPPRLEAAHFRLAINLAKAGEANRALQAFSDLGAAYPHSRYVPQALFAMAGIYAHAGMPEEAARRYRQLTRKPDAGGLADLSRLKLALLALEEPVDVARARAYLQEVASLAYQAKAAAILREIETLDHLPKKDPWVAGGLSTLLPGAGHLYLDRPKDGWVAFVSNALLIIGTVQSFRRGISGLGVALGILEWGWYTGTLFGAVSLAHRGNRQARDAWRGRIRANVSLAGGSE